MRENDRCGNDRSRFHCNAVEKGDISLNQCQITKYMLLQKLLIMFLHKQQWQSQWLEHSEFEIGTVVSET